VWSELEEPQVLTTKITTIAYEAVEAVALERRKRRRSGGRRRRGEGLLKWYSVVGGVVVAGTAVGLAMYWRRVSSERKLITGRR